MLRREGVDNSEIRMEKRYEGREVMTVRLWYFVRRKSSILHAGRRPTIAAALEIC